MMTTSDDRFTSIMQHHDDKPLTGVWLEELIDSMSGFPFSPLNRFLASCIMHELEQAWSEEPDKVLAPDMDFGAPIGEWMSLPSNPKAQAFEFEPFDTGETIRDRVTLGATPHLFLASLFRERDIEITDLIRDPDENHRLSKAMECAVDRIEDVSLRRMLTMARNDVTQRFIPGIEAEKLQLDNEERYYEQIEKLAGKPLISMLRRIYHHRDLGDAQPESILAELEDIALAHGYNRVNAALSMVDITAPRATLQTIAKVFPEVNMMGYVGLFTHGDDMERWF